MNEWMFIQSGYISNTNTKTQKGSVGVFAGLLQQPVPGPQPYFPAASNCMCLCLEKNRMWMRLISSIINKRTCGLG